MISLLVIACNEEHRLEACIASARPAVDEVVVVVQESQDRTLDIAHRCADVVATDRCHGLSEPSRPVGSAACTGEWVLYLDADETLTPWAAARLLWLCRADAPDLYRLRERTTVGGQVIEDAPHARLFRRDRVTAPVAIHSEFTPVPGARVATIADAVCIEHIKSWDEQNLDNARYASLNSRAIGTA